MNNKFIYILLICFTVAKAQGPLNTYFMDYNPYSFYLNPGKLPNFKTFVAFPALGNFTTSAYSGVAINKAFNDGNLDVYQLLNELNQKNNFGFNQNINVLAFGFSPSEKSYFSFSTGVKAEFNFGLNKDFAGLFLLGNGHPNYLGKTADFTGTGLKSNAYADINLGYTRVINDKLTIGANFKILNGLGAAGFNLKGVGIYTDADTWETTFTSDFEIYVTEVETTDEDEFGLPGNFNYSGFKLGKNLGLGLDLGASYKLSDKIELSASVVDLGYINYKNAVKYYNDGSSFTFQGIDFNDINNDGDSNYGDALLDTLTTIFGLKKDSNVSYSTYLPTRFILGGKYQLNKYFTVDALYSGRFVNNTMQSSLIIGSGVKVGKVLSARLSYGLINNSFFNLGSGITLNLGAFQVFAVADHFIGFSQVDYTRYLNLSAGMNFVFGRGRTYESKKSDETPTE
jgi:hypothetical protein